MLIKPFGKVMKDLQSPSTYDSYIGVVADNNDPKKLGRVRVLIPVYEDMNLEDYPWACPTMNTFLGNSANSISFSIPEVGSQVRVTFPTKDVAAPYYSGCELNDENKSTFFDEDYPNCYGSKDSVGNFIKINKAKETVHIQHSSTLNLQVSKDGSFAITNPRGTYLVADKSGNISLNDAKVVTTNCAEFDIHSGVSTVDIPSVTFTGDVKINGSFTPLTGTGAVVPLPNGKTLVFTNGLLTAYK